MGACLLLGWSLVQRLVFNIGPWLNMLVAYRHHRGDGLLAAATAPACQNRDCWAGPGLGLDRWAASVPSWSVRATRRKLRSGGIRGPSRS
jgi:hypothetical protein